MTITDSAIKYRYEGNASTDTFAFSGKAFTATDLVVEIITRSTDALEETLTLTTDYNVTINTDGTASIVTVAGKIPSATQDIQIRRDLEQKNETELPTGSSFPAKSVENAIDRTIGIVQEQDEGITRSLKFPITSSTTTATLPEPVDNASILFDGTTGLFKIGPTSTEITNAESNATAAAASASAAATSESNASTSASEAAASAAGVNLPSITATDTGKLLVVNAAGTAHELLGDGTSGQVLLSAGADALPTWGDASREVSLQTKTISSDTAIEFINGTGGADFSSTYKEVVFDLYDIVLAVNANSVIMTISTDAGVSYESANYTNSGITVQSDATTVTSNNGSSLGSITLDDVAAIGNAAGRSFSATVKIINPSNSSLYKLIDIESRYVTQSGYLYTYKGSAMYEGDTDAITGIKFTATGGNAITSGSIVMTGKK